MLRAWVKHGFLQKYVDKREYPPEETVVVYLAEHTIESKHHPYIEVLVNDKQVGKIGFEIIVALEIKGVGLSIQDGKIKEIQSGDCKGTGIIKCGNLVILKRDSVPISLPGSINLDRGMPITH